MNNKKSILICTQSLLQGGLETRILDEVTWLVNHEFDVYIAYGGQPNKNLIDKLAKNCSTESYFFKTNATATELLADVEKLRNYIQNYNIKQIYIHPFGSILPATIAAEYEKIPRTITLHGAGSVNLGQYYGNLYNIICWQIIFPGVEEILTVANRVKLMLLNQLFSNLPKHLTVVPNGVDINRYSVKTKQIFTKKILILSRLDGDRFVAIRKLLHELKSEIEWMIDIAGEGNYTLKLKEEVKNLGMEHRVSFLGFIYEPEYYLKEYTFVAASGRALLEAASMGCYCILLDNESPLYLVKLSDLEMLSDDNFTGRSFNWNCVPDLIYSLEQTLIDRPANLATWVREHRDQFKIFDDYGFSSHNFEENPLFTRMFEAIIKEGIDNYNIPFVSHPRVWKEIYHILKKSSIEFYLENEYINFLELRYMEMNQLLWDTRQSLQMLQSSNND